MKIKICGITNLEDALFCESSGADALGFIFYEKGRRYIDPAEARRITLELSPFTCKVGVFVNHSAQEINNIARIAGLNLVQLHGDETPAICHDISLPVIKSFRINDEFDFNILDKWKEVHFLFDTYSNSDYGRDIFIRNTFPKKTQDFTKK